MGSVSSAFTDFIGSTGPSYVTGPEVIMNDAVAQTYILSKMLKGKSPNDVLAGGSSIKDEIMFDESNTFTPYLSNAQVTYENPQVLDTWTSYFRYYLDHMTWTDHEVLRQVTPGMSRAAKHQVYKRIKYSKEQRMVTSMVKGMEAALWRVPIASEMEGEDALYASSIPKFVNEDANTLFDWQVGGAGSVFTTVDGIASATKTGWQNQTSVYSTSTINVATNVISNFDEMYDKVNYVPPAYQAQYFENQNIGNQYIACSSKGKNVLSQELRRHNDHTRIAPQDAAYPMPSFGGIPVYMVKALDTAALYDDGSDALTTELAAADKGPRYYFLNATYLHPMYHTERYMERLPVMTPERQPTTHFVPVDTWWTMVCKSRSRLGIVSPAGEVYT